MKPGKGAAFVRSKLKNLLTGNSNERTFRAGEMINVADVMRREGQFTYAEGDNVSNSFSQGWGLASTGGMRTSSQACVRVRVIVCSREAM